MLEPAVLLCEASEGAAFATKHESSAGSVTFRYRPGTAGPSSQPFPQAGVDKSEVQP
jgi:hypothetical protein